MNTEEPKTVTFAAAVGPYSQIPSPPRLKQSYLTLACHVICHLIAINLLTISLFKREYSLQLTEGLSMLLEKGTCVMLFNGKSSTKILLKDVLYAPKMGLTLISIGKIDIAGFASLFHKGNLTVFTCGKKKKKLATIPLKNGLYHLEHKAEVAAVVREELVTIERLHKLMGHISLEAAKALVQKGVVEGFKLDETSKILSCDSCEYGKAHRKEVKKERQFPRASNIGDEIHSDVWGPSPVKTIGGREYYSSFTDDNSCYSKLYLQRTKDETFTSYKTYEAELLRQKGIHIKSSIRTEAAST